MEKGKRHWKRGINFPLAEAEVTDNLDAPKRIGERKGGKLGGRKNVGK